MLFPELAPPASGLVGIARLASEAPTLEEKRRVEYRELTARRFIGRVSGRRMPFDWTVNPYRGCEFGCRYCYARYTHEFMELREPEDFETQIFVKHFRPELFRCELAKIPSDESIAIGTATDPYQPAERRYGITRAMLQIFAEGAGRRLCLATKSDLVARDTELLAAVARRNSVVVSITVTTMDEALARILEPYAPRPSLRLEAMRGLSEAGVAVSVLACPVMPLINDSVASLRAVARAAKEAGAVSMHGNVLFLKPCAQSSFFPMLEERYPHLLRRYRERYQDAHFLRGPYVDTIKKRVEAIRDEFSLAARSLAPPEHGTNCR